MSHPAPPHQPTERVAGIIRMLMAGRPTPEIVAELGVSRQCVANAKKRYDLHVVRSWSDPTPQTTTQMRRCLSCDKQFESAGPGNRLCGICKGGEAFAGSQPTVHAVVGL